MAFRKVCLLGLLVTAIGVGAGYSTRAVAEDAAITIAPQAAAKNISAYAPNKNSQLVEFLNETFELSSQITGTNVTLNEYIRTDEQLTNWTKMIGVFHFPLVQDKSAVLKGLVAEMRNDPNAHYEIHNNPATGEIGIDFLVLNTAEDGSEVAEFNVFVFRDRANGDGIVSQQYAERAYGEAVEPFLTTLQNRRSAVVSEVLNYDFPEVVK